MMRHREKSDFRVTVHFMPAAACGRYASLPEIRDAMNF